MRTTFLILAIATSAGCAGTKDAQRPSKGVSAQEVPLVRETPTISERARFKRQQDAEKAMVGLTTVEGGVKR